MTLVDGLNGDLDLENIDFESLNPMQRMMLAEVLAVAEERGITIELDERQEKKLRPPETDDELWEAVRDLTGYRIPRAAVCTHLGHVAPFTVFADLFFERRTDVMCIGNRGGGKLLHIDCKVPTPSGWTTMGDIRDGDAIFDERGQICTVLKAHEIEPNPDAYIVCFSDGEEIKADAEHLWYTEARLPRGGRKKHTRRHPGIRTTKQISERVETYTEGEYNHSIPLAKPFQLPDADLPLDPYVLGAWLGDGAADRGAFHSNQDETDFLCQQLEAAGFKSRVAHGAERSPKSTIIYGEGIGVTLLKKMGIYRNKHVPDTYLRASIDQRMALLQGLMDTDGSVDKEGKAEFITVFPALRDGVSELLRTLGFKGTWSEKWVTPCESSNVPGEKYGPYFRFRIQPYSDRPIVRMPHKLARLKSRPETQPMSEGRRIVAVEPIDPVPMRCLTVDSPNGLFLVGEGMVPTHNTTLSGFLHGAKNRYFPNYKSAVAGSVEKQGQRAYAEFKRFTRLIAAEIVTSLQSKTTWLVGSEFEVLGGTLKALNGPHPYLAQFDEVELTGLLEFEEFQNMAQGDEHHIAQNLLTSTRKWPGGIVQMIVDEVDAAIEAGVEVPWEVMIFCVFETMENVSSCGVRCKCEGPTHKPEETGCKGCGCDKIVKGEWENGSPRTFMSVCNDRAKRADGFVRLQDVQARFRRLSKRTWEAQQECLRPNTEGLVHYWFDVDKHVLAKWIPRPEYGPVFRSWDWGGTNPHVCLFHQVTRVPIKIGRIVVPEGSMVTFDEIYHPGGSFRDLGFEVAERTYTWQKYGFDWDITNDVCDPAGATAKVDVKQAFQDIQAEYPGLQLPDWKSLPSRVEDSLEKHIAAGEDGLLYVVGAMCPNTVREYGVYSWPKNNPNKNRPTKPMEKDDHTCDSTRYQLWFLYKTGRQVGGEMPEASMERHEPQGRVKQEEAERLGRKIPGVADQSPAGSSFESPYVTGDPARSSGGSVVREFAAPSVRR